MFGKSEKLLEDIDNLLQHHLEQKINQSILNSFNRYLEKFQELVDDEKEIIEESSKKAIEKITIVSNKISKIDAISKTNQKLSNEVTNLVQEIRKRDAIIERKNKQIANLKGQ